jgi:hypothetical protein
VLYAINELCLNGRHAAARICLRVATDPTVPLRMRSEPATYERAAAYVSGVYACAFYGVAESRRAEAMNSLTLV